MDAIASSVLVDSLSGKENLKGLVVKVLSQEWPLKARQVFNELPSKRKFTYQGVHKAIVALVEEGVVSKGPAGYSLSKPWLHDAMRNLSKIISSYEAKDFSLFSKNSVKMSAEFSSLSLLKKLILSGELSLSRDETLLSGNRLCMMPMALYLEWFSQLDGKPGNAVYNSCRLIGEAWHRGLQQAGLVSSSTDEQLRSKAETLSFAGWGELSFDSVDVDKKQAAVSVHYSPFAKEYVSRFGKSKRPVDDAVRGFLCGTFMVLFNDSSIQCVEKKCTAKGDEKCFFELGPHLR